MLSVELLLQLVVPIHVFVRTLLFSFLFVFVKIARETLAHWLDVDLLLLGHARAWLRHFGLLSKDSRLSWLDDARMVPELEDALILGKLLAELGQRKESLIWMRSTILFVH